MVWAIEQLAPSEADQVLEVGCGHGVAVSLVCERLTKGSVTGLDRSAKMIEIASRRNAHGMAAGKVNFIHSSFEQSGLDRPEFDRIFAFHVAAFWKQPAVTLPLVRTLLRPGGELWLFNQLPGWGQSTDAAAFALELKDALAGQGFESDQPVFGKLDSGTALCIRARPATSPG